MHFIESEYLALSQAMRDLILLRETLKEVNLEVFKKRVHIPKCSANAKSFDDIVSTEKENSIPKSKRYMKIIQLVSSLLDYHGLLLEPNILQYPTIGSDLK